MPTGYNNWAQKMYALARACHETVNRHFKHFGCTYRHPLHWHGTMYHALANITQLAIMDNEPLYQVDYDDSRNGGAMNYIFSPLTIIGSF